MSFGNVHQASQKSRESVTLEIFFVVAGVLSNGSRKASSLLGTMLAL